MSGNGWSGMNPEQVQAAATQLEHLSDRTDKLITKVDSEMNKLQNAWHGPDAKKFQGEWDGTHKTQLKKISQLLKQMAQSAKQNLSEQKSASAH